MKVLQINGVAKSGSTGKIVSGIEKELVSDGHISLIAYSGNKESFIDGNYYKVGSRLTTKVHQILAFLLGDAGFHSSLETKRLINYIKREKPDIIHLHNIYSFYLNVDMLMSFLSVNDIPVVWTIHDCWAFTGKCTHFIFNGCEKWKNACYSCPLWREYPTSLFFDRTRSLYRRKKKLYDGLNNKMMLVCVSHWLKSIVDQSMLKNFPNTVIYNGINLDIFKPAVTKNMREKYNLTDKTVVLGVSNGWGKNKGLQEFLELSKIIDESICIVLVGLSDDQINSLPKNILGIPKTKNAEELSEWYNNADVFVSFSKAETMGMVVVEALSCGTPAVVMPTTASPELIDATTGFVNASATPTECYQHIKQVQKHGKSYYSFSCIQRAGELFSSTTNYKKYVELYKKMLGEGNL